MPFTKQRLQSIMQHRGQAFVHGTRLPYSARVCETYLRLKLYRLEDRAALDEFKLVQAANRDIREYGLQQATRLHVSTVGMDAASLQWKRAMKAYIGQRVNALGDAIAYNAYEWATKAYTASFYGRQWLMDSLLPTRQLNHARLNTSTASENVLQPQTEAVLASADVYRQQGQDWRENYQLAVGTSLIKAQRTVNASDQSPLTTLTNVAVALGATSKPNKQTTGLYAATSVLTRTAVMRSSNQAATESYRLNAELIPGLEWVTSHDSRVCPQCERMDGTVFPLEGLTGLILFNLPPDGSHYGCRCGVVPTLVPTLTREANTDAPADTFEEWADAFGVGVVLDDFFADEYLESTQI